MKAEWTKTWHRIFLSGGVIWRKFRRKFCTLSRNFENRRTCVYGLCSHYIPLRKRWQCFWWHKVITWGTVLWKGDSTIRSRGYTFISMKCNRPCLVKILEGNDCAALVWYKSQSIHESLSNVGNIQGNNQSLGACIDMLFLVFSETLFTRIII